MPKPTKGPRLGGGPAHERLLLANLAAALFTHKSIKTTETKAKRLRPLAERLVTFAKRGDLHARRRVLSVIGDKEVVHVLFTEIAPLVADREGGYTRITKVGNRKGDNAPMAVIELVLEPVNEEAVGQEGCCQADAAPRSPRRLPPRRPRPRRPPPPTTPPRPAPSRPRRARPPRLLPRTPSRPPPRRSPSNRTAGRSRPAGRGTPLSEPASQHPCHATLPRETRKPSRACGSRAFPDSARVPPAVGWSDDREHPG